MTKVIDFLEFKRLHVASEAYKNDTFSIMEGTIVFKKLHEKYTDKRNKWLVTKRYSGNVTIVPYNNYIKENYIYNEKSLIHPMINYDAINSDNKIMKTLLPEAELKNLVVNTGMDANRIRANHVNKLTTNALSRVIIMNSEDLEPKIEGE